jgi:glucose-6-phosphate isomerase
LNKQKFAIIVISKSGTTLEPALAFQLIRKQLEKNVGAANLNKLIVAITDYHKGTLHDFAKEQGYTMFGIPDNVGGRFSTLTAVGLFPMLLKGIDPIQVLKGAKQALKDTESPSLLMNSAFLYACYRNYLYKNRKLSVENFVVYDPNLTFVAEM